MDFLTATELRMIEGMDDSEVGLLLCDYTMERWADLTSGQAKREDVDRFIEEHGKLCALYSRKLVGRISNTRRTYNALPVGHRLEADIRQALEDGERRHVEACLNHHEQRQYLAALNPKEERLHAD